MADNTPNIGLYKKDPVKDKNDTFNIKTMLNDNWDKIDKAAGRGINIQSYIKDGFNNYIVGAKPEVQENIVKIPTGVSHTATETSEILPIDLSFAPAVKGRCDLMVVDEQGNISVVEGADGASEKAFRVEEDGVISQEYIKNIPDIFKDSVKVWNSGVTGDIETGWEYRHYIGASNGVRLYTKNGSIYIGFLGTKIDLILPTYSWLDTLIYSVDDNTPISFNPNELEVLEQYSLTLTDSLPFGYHEVKIELETSLGNNDLLVDAFDIYIPAAPQLPEGTQEIAKVYVMPELVTMQSIPARPSSTEEAGWVRIESDSENCKYIGDGWEERNYINQSAGSRYQTDTAGDYAEFTFIGDGIRYISSMEFNFGIIGISIDGSAESFVDLYSSSMFPQRVVYENNNLIFGKHTIKIRCTDTKNESSSGYWIIIDAFEVHRPLYLEDTRNLFPVTKYDSYTLEHKTKTNFAEANGKVGEILDKLWQGKNIIIVENEYGTAYKYPDGKAVFSYAEGKTHTHPNSYGSYYRSDMLEKIFPIDFVKQEYISIVATNICFATIFQTKSNSITFYTVSLDSAQRTSQYFILVIGRWK